MKIKQFQKALQKKRIDLALFCNLDFNSEEKNMIYFSGSDVVGALVIPARSSPFMVVPKMDYLKAKEGKIKKVYVWKKGSRLFEYAKQQLKKNKVRYKRIGIDKNVFTLNVYKSLKKHFSGSSTVDISSYVMDLRKTKTKEEIRIMTKACQMSDSILKLCLKRFKRFKKETEVVSFIETKAKELGCDMAFPTIVASGKNALKPHHYSKDNVLKKGFCVIDFGIRYKRYCTDTTRTVYLGKPSKKEVALYELVKQVQENLIKSIKPGIRCEELYLKARSLLGRYSKYFNHGLGHGIGVNIHELPNITLNSKEIIRDAMVFSVEPGIYFNNLGIRIEDTVLFLKKPIRLTKIGKELITT